MIDWDREFRTREESLEASLDTLKCEQYCVNLCCKKHLAQVLRKFNESYKVKRQERLAVSRESDCDFAVDKAMTVLDHGIMDAVEGAKKLTLMEQEGVVLGHMACMGEAAVERGMKGVLRQNRAAALSKILALTSDWAQDRMLWYRKMLVQHCTTDRKPAAALVASAPGALGLGATLTCTICMDPVLMQDFLVCPTCFMPVCLECMFSMSPQGVERQKKCPACSSMGGVFVFHGAKSEQEFLQYKDVMLEAKANQRKRRREAFEKLKAAVLEPDTDDDTETEDGQEDPEVHVEVRVDVGEGAGEEEEIPDSQEDEEAPRRVRARVGSIGY